MIQKFIHDSFELDLSIVPFTLVEENNWFNTQFFSKYTYPGELELTREQDIALGYLTEMYLQNRQTLFPGRFYTMNRRHDAVLELEKIIGRKVTFQIRYGLEELPNAQKKLSEIPMMDFAIEGMDIFEYADSVIDSAWPAENFCFPKLHTDRISTDDETWSAFQGAINNYQSGAMVINEYDAIEDVQLNRNLVQPMPFMLYVLKQGFQDAGWNLMGDVMNDEDFQKSFIYHFSEYYHSTNAESQLFQLNTSEYTELVNPIFARYENAITLPEPGRYKIAGNVILRSKGGSNSTNSMPNGFASAILLFDGNGLWSSFLSTYIGYKEKFVSLDINIDFHGDEGDITFGSFQLPFSQFDEGYDYEAMIADLTITQLAKFDSNGDPIATLIIPNEIKLQKCVPDMTFGEFFETIRKWKNFDLSFNGANAFMNFITEQLDTAGAVSLMEKEVKEPEIYFNQGKKFALKLADIQSDVYTFPGVYVDINGTQTTPFVNKEIIEETVINAVVLPLLLRNADLTAHDFLTDSNRLMIGFYQGLIAGKNHTLDASNLLPQALYENHYREWFDFLLTCFGYEWDFTSNFEEIYNLKISDPVYAYKRYHIIERLSRTNITPDIILTEIVTKTLK